MRPIESKVEVAGVGVAVYEWPGAGRPLFFVHATGFHSRCWDQVITNLPGRQCYAVDLRGHGRSDKPTPPYDWKDIGAEVAAVARQLGLQGAIGIGHSMGGHTVTYAAALHPDLFSSLLLIDPVILPKERYGGPPRSEHFSARRRNEWSSPEEMYDRFKDRAPFSDWAPAVLRDYCEYGLLPAADGNGYVLACPPRIEASYYEQNGTGDIYDEIATIQLPTLILRAGFRPEPGTMDFRGSPTVPDLVTYFAHGRDVLLSTYTHFIPMEAPALIADYVRELETQGS